MHVCWICFALDDVENTDVATGFAGVDRNHAVLGLQQATHDIQDRCLSDCLSLFDIIACERRV